MRMATLFGNPKAEPSFTDERLVIKLLEEKAQCCRGAYANSIHRTVYADMKSTPEDVKSNLGRTNFCSLYLSLIQENSRYMCIIIFSEISGAFIFIFLEKD